MILFANISQPCQESQIPRTKITEEKTLIIKRKISFWKE